MRWAADLMHDFSLLKIRFLCKITISEKKREKEKKSQIFFAEHLEIVPDL